MFLKKMKNMKYILFSLFVVIGFFAKAQNNNEWIDYAKTYYKFRIHNDGLYRINQSTIQAAGLGSTPVQNFQLWRNGVQVPIFISNGSGAMTASDYIEFFGKANDGTMDTKLYKFEGHHQNRKWNLYDDTASYFLTINANVSQNLRLVNTANNVAGNTLPVTQNFLHIEGNYPKSRIHPGFGTVVGEYLHSSAYDNGEGWAANELFDGASYTAPVMNNLFPDLTSIQSCTVKQYAAGFSSKSRQLSVSINNNNIFSHDLSFFNTNTYPVTNVNSASFNVSILSSGSAAIVTTPVFTPPTLPNGDRYTIAMQEIIYPRLFNFGGKSNFEFTLPANASGNYLEITNFNFGAATPVLYDLTNGARYVANVNGSQLRFRILPSAVERNLVLVSEAATNIASVNSLQTRNFTNFIAAANQGDYLILTSKYLHPTPGDLSNPVEKFKTYRASIAGGGFTTKIIDVEDLYDQYAFGAWKHAIAIRNYLKHARTSFTTAPKYVFLIGRGVMYQEVKAYEGQPYMDQLNSLPTYGWPASDNLFTADAGQPLAITPIGRIGVINTSEIEAYYNKVVEYEQKQADNNFTIANKLWMKQGTFVTGSSEPLLQNQLDTYNNEYRNNYWNDTLIGGNSNLFTKTAAGGVVPLTNTFMEQMWNTGHSLLEYFGHSSATALEFNIDDPQIYSNQGKYPMMVVNGCNAGNFFVYNPYRITTNNNQTLSEKFTLAANRGTIGFIASTSYGIVNYLHYFNRYFFQGVTNNNYGNRIGDQLRYAANNILATTGVNDFYGRMQVEQNLLQGDPAIKLKVTYPKPDYVVEDQTVTVNPTFISVAEPNFTLKVKYYNLGKAPNDSINIRIDRQLPNGQTILAELRRVKAALYADSLTFVLPIDASRDKGNTRLTICLDSDNEVDEMSETNNCLVKDITIFEDEIRPIHPYNYGIVNTLPLRLTASTANPLVISRTYNLEMDTTELFNSTSKQTQTLTQVGGVLEFAPITSLIPNTTYYWRVSIAGANPLRWNGFSFTYLPTETPGFNQGHYFQNQKSTYTHMYLDSATRRLKFELDGINITVRSCVWPQGCYEEGHAVVSINQDAYIRGISVPGQYLTFNVFDPVTGLPWRNGNPGNPGQYGSNPVFGPGREWNFVYKTETPAQRQQAAEFMENNIPDGHYVIVRNEILEPWFNPGWGNPINSTAAQWATDFNAYGMNALYHRLKAQGFSTIDSLNGSRALIFIYKKNRGGEFTPKEKVTDGVLDRIVVNATFNVPKREGYILSPKFGPAKEWKEVHWRGFAMEPTVGDTAKLTIIGVRANNQEDSLTTIDQSQLDFNIQNINANTYPYLRLKMLNKDSKTATPWQVDYLRLNYLPVPEGAIAPNISFTLRDTVDIGELQNLKIDFKNVSYAAFDSIKVKLTVRNNSTGVTTNYTIPKQKKLNPGEVLTLNYSIPTINLTGANTLYVEFNPDNDQPEQFYFNNFLYKNFTVRPDGVNPLLDVTFDGTHIINRDIVSPNPNILIKLMDDSKYFALDDTSGLKVQLRYPGNNVPLQTINWNTDTLRFYPADLSTGENVARAEFKPKNLPDGEYELVVGGKDRSGNASGSLQYRVLFNVVNKQMISNLMNYPNPFSTSTAFVFTLTGNEMPQGLKIEIMTITGKIVKEIKMAELGPLRIGRNITDYKWDGTDQFGNKLANGVYLYRVLNKGSNGAVIEKYTADGDNTDKYFKAGYGKIVILR
jgi:hypothetical protein